MGENVDVNVTELTDYARQLGFYQGEADRFADLVDRADVTGEAWGLAARWARQSYTDRLTELRSLLTDLKEGVATLSEKITQSAAVYQGREHDTTIRFGHHEAELDGPL